MIVEVVCPIPLNKSFDYLMPAALNVDDPESLVGRRVRVPFGLHQRVGVIIALKETSDAPVAKLKEVAAVLDEESLLNEKMRALGRWLSERYACTYGEALFWLFPPGKENPKSFKDPGTVGDVSYDSVLHVGAAPTLTADQNNAAAILHNAVFGSAQRAFLLFGAAATGKTEVYLSAIKDVLAQGKAALYLVPEIGLAVQATQVLAERFGEKNVLAWHSDMKASERIAGWMRIRRGEVAVVVGPRSAALAPLPNLGVIIVDEEHDHSYKEERKPRFHARDVALFRAAQEGGVAVLGSATPSLETYQRGLDGELEMIELRQRAIPSSIPQMKLVDVTKEKAWAALSPTMLANIGERLNKHEQSLLFLNRRGFHRFLRCPSCTWVAQCPQCSIALVEHKIESTTKKKRAKGLWCHYCSYTMDAPAACPQCSHAKLFMGGVGTQRVETEIREKFPWARIIRWDRDAISRRGDHKRIFEEFKDGEFDILIGTQMVAQGFNFPRVTLVGILDADTSLYIPDFRSSERTFQMLAQVAGRAGRAMITGDVILQTRNAEHAAIRYALSLDFAGFAKEELQHRNDLNYPPFTHLVEVVSVASNPRKATDEMERFLTWVQTVQLPGGAIGVLGPTAARRTWKGGKSRFVALLKIPRADLSLFLGELKRFLALHTHSFQVDIDPESLQ